MNARTTLSADTGLSPDTRRGTRAQGNVSVLVIAFIAVTMLLGVAVARLGGGVVEKSRASNAADAAALAAAGLLGRGRPAADACAVARSTAADNGARLLTCHCGDAFAEVIVALADARAQARAQVDIPPEPAAGAGYRAGRASGDSS